VPDRATGGQCAGSGLVGTPQLLAERLRRYEQVGIDIMMTRFTPMMEEWKLSAPRSCPPR